MIFQYSNNDNDYSPLYLSKQSIKQSFVQKYSNCRILNKKFDCKIGSKVNKGLENLFTISIRFELCEDNKQHFR